MLKNSRAPQKCERTANNQKTLQKTQKTEKLKKQKKMITGHIDLQTIFARSLRKAGSKQKYSKREAKRPVDQMFSWTFEKFLFKFEQVSHLRD